MKREGLICAIAALSSTMLLSGCVVRSYELTRERVDQNLGGGNRGYLMGQAPSASEERKLTRDTRVVEIELRSPLKFEKGKKPAAQAPVVTETSEGNKGYMSEEMPVQPETPAMNFQQYKVEKNDTLQKISQKFYGTTKKWQKIFEANKETLKTPDRIRPGQTLNIPVLPEMANKEAMKEPKENLK